MILIDSSVLIAFLRTRSSTIDDTFYQHECAVCGVIRSEILRGAGDDQDFRALERSLDGFTQLPVREAVWDRLGGYLAQLRRSGLSVPFQDVLLAAVALDHDAALWSYDRHFQMMQSVLVELDLFEGPTP